VLNKSEINKILVISLTNIGDVILTFPVIDTLIRDFPSAKLSVVIGPKAESLLQENPRLDKVHVFDKHQSLMKSLSWILELRKERFDLIVDLRNTAIPFMISPRRRTSCRVEKAGRLHMAEKHLRRLKSVHAVDAPRADLEALHISRKDEKRIEKLVEKEIGWGHKYAVVASGAADRSKQWTKEGFAFMCDRLIEDYGIGIVFAGDENDRQAAGDVEALMKCSALNLCGQTTLTQLAALFKHCFFVVANDSAPMHLASYMDVPVLALFGPTDPGQYGPWSSRSCFLRKNESCRACASPRAPSDHTCLAAITGEDVLGALQINMADGDIHFRQ